MLFYVVALLTSFLHAQSETLVSSVYDGKTPYMLVHADENGPSTRSPGIYGSGEQGSWFPIVLGNILQGSACLGILAQLEVTNLDHRYAALAVVDGRLVLFELSAANEVRVAVLGEGDFSVETLEGQRVSLPLIRDLSQIHVSQMDLSEEGQRVLVSMQTPQSPYGDGVTFAFYVAPNIEGTPGPSLKGQPILIENHFLPVAALEKQSVLVDPFVFSRPLARSIWFKEWKRVGKHLEAWLDFIKGVIHSAQPNLAENEKEQMSLPLIHLPSRSVQMTSQPQFGVLAGPFSFRQVIDVLEGFDTVEVKSDVGSSFVHGRLYGNTDRPEIRYFAQEAYQAPHAAVAIIGTEMHFFLKRKQQLSLSLGPPPVESPEDWSVVFREIQDSMGEVHICVIISMHDKDESKTHVYLLEHGSKPLHLVRSFLLNDYWFHAQTLHARFHHPKFESETGEFIFDTLSNPTWSVEDYFKKHSAFIPHLNLTKTIHPSHPEYSYKHELERHALLEGSVYFKRYEKGPDASSPTGLYVKDKKHQERLVLPGEMLQHPLVNSSGEFLFAQREWKLNPQQAIPLKLSLFAIDPEQQGGTHLHKMVAVISVLETDKEEPEFLPFVLPWTIHRPIQDLKAVLLLPVFFNQAYYWVVLAHYESLQGDKTRAVLESRAFAFVDPPSFEGIRSANWLPKVNRVLELQFSTLMMQDRDPWVESLKVDKQGGVYWLINPEIALDDDQSAYKHLLTQQLLFPNRFRDRGADFLPSSDLEAYVKEGLLRHIEPQGLKRPMNRLGLMTRYDIQRMFSVKSEDLEQAQSVSDQFEGIDTKLHELVRFENRTPSRDIILVSRDKQEQLFNYLLTVLTQERTPKNGFSLDNRALYWSGIDPSNDSQAEWMSSLEMLRDLPSDTRTPILIGRLDDVLQTGSLKQDWEFSPRYLLKNELDEDQKINPILAYWLATEGKRVELKPFRENPLTTGKIQMILIASEEDLSQIKKGKHLVYPGQTLLQYFNVHDEFFTGQWKMWGPGSSTSSKELRIYEDQPFSGLDEEVLPSLSQALEDLTDQEKDPEHRVLLVPTGLKSLVERMIFGRWMAKERPQDPWNHKNRALQLYVLPNQKVTQESLIDNFCACRMGRGRHRNVLIGQLGDVIRAGRAPLRSGNRDMWEHRGWMIRDGAEDLSRPDLFVSPDVLGHRDKKTHSAILPHTLYWMATEGRLVSLERFGDVGVKPEVSILLIGEKAEWDLLERETNVENRYGLHSTFKIDTLQPPGRETKRSLLSTILDRPEIQRIGYKYFAQDLVVGAQATPLSSQEAQSKLLSYLVNRSETLAQQFAQESTAAFIRVLTAFRNAVVEDPELRNHKRIDRPYLERLLSRIFSIPLNLNILAPDDPYVLLSHERSALRLQEAGYRGPLELKSQVISTLLAPTRNDPTRSIPGSIIIFGDSSTGKTMLFKTMMKMLGLKEYLYGQSTDDESQFMVLNVGKLTTRAENKSGEIMLVDDALKHVNHFLSLPFGFRGHILFDDLHKGDKDVIRIILKFLQSLFDAEHGMIRVERLGHFPGATSTEIPVRNIHLWLTLNPTQDQQKIERYTKGRHPTDVDVVVATLSSEDNPIERSFLLRWGLVLNLSRFPLDAKAPALHDSLRTSSRNDFNVQGRLVFVAPEAVSKVVAAFPDSNAREFLSAATSQLLQVAQEGPQRSTLSMVVPRPNSAKRVNMPQNWEASGRENGTIEQFIRQQTVAFSVNDQPEGQLFLLKLMLDSLRTQWYQVLVDGLTQDERFAGSTQALKHCLTPMLQAMHTQLKKKPFIPLRYLDLDPKDFLLERPKYPAFLRIISNSEESEKPFFDPAFLRSVDSFQTRNFGVSEDPSREEVLRETLRLLQEQAEKFLSHVLRVGDVRLLPKHETWIQGLTEEEPLGALDKIGTDILTLYFRFWNDMFDARLIESRNAAKFRPLSTYDVARLFTLALDRAIASLDWGKVTHFMIQNLRLLSEDLEIGQRPAVQHYLFNARFSLVKVFAHEQVFQIANSSQAFREWSQDFSTRLEEEFLSSVWRSFSKQGEH